MIAVVYICFLLYINLIIAFQVRAYHKQFYRPENLCCIIVGQVEPEKVFEALIPVEERILQEVLLLINILNILISIDVCIAV